MAMMKPGDLRSMTVDQLDDEALRLKKERFNLRFQRATGQLENTARARSAPRHRAHQDGGGAEAPGRNQGEVRITRCRSARSRASW